MPFRRELKCFFFSLVLKLLVYGRMKLLCRASTTVTAANTCNTAPFFFHACPPRSLTSGRMQLMTSRAKPLLEVEELEAALKELQNGTTILSEFWIVKLFEIRTEDTRSLIEANLSEPHASVTAVAEVACMSVCLWPYTVNFKWALWNISWRPNREHPCAYTENLNWTNGCSNLHTCNSCSVNELYANGNDCGQWQTRAGCSQMVRQNHAQLYSSLQVMAMNNHKH